MDWHLKPIQTGFIRDTGHFLIKTAGEIFKKEKDLDMSTMFDGLGVDFDILSRLIDMGNPKPCSQKCLGLHLAQSREELSKYFISFNKKIKHICYRCGATLDCSAKSEDKVS